MYGYSPAVLYVTPHRESLFCRSCQPIPPIKSKRDELTRTRNGVSFLQSIPALVQTRHCPPFVAQIWLAPALECSVHAIASRLPLLRQLLADLRLSTTLSNEDVNYVNIITLGPSGAGKSALINHLASALLGRYWRHVQVGLSTSALRKVELCFAESSDETLRLWDMPGWEHIDVRL